MADQSDLKKWAQSQQAAQGGDEGDAAAADQGDGEKSPSEVLLSASMELREVVDMLTGVVDKLDDPKDVQDMIDDLNAKADALEEDSDELEGSEDEDEDDEDEQPAPPPAAAQPGQEQP